MNYKRDAAPGTSSLKLSICSKIVTWTLVTPLAGQHLSVIPDKTRFGTQCVAGSDSWSYFSYKVQSEDGLCLRGLQTHCLDSTVGILQRRPSLAGSSTESRTQRQLEHHYCVWILSQQTYCWIKLKLKRH